MRPVSSRGLITLCGLGIFGALIVSPPVAAQVDSSGELHTEIPIRVPTYHGVEPSLAFRYRSRGGGGTLGVGWSVSGFSIIDRVSAHRGTAQIDETDKYLLDGVELLPCQPYEIGTVVGTPPIPSGTPSPSCVTAWRAFGSASGFFYTRWESYLRIRKDGTSQDSWTLWRKDGTVVAYAPLQKAANGSITVRWAVRSVTDTHGNTASYNYWCEQDDSRSQCYPKAIQYGAVSGQPSAPGAVIDFYWEKRPDPWSYGNGRLVTVNYRLKAISVSALPSPGNIGRVRAYALSYGVPSAGSNRSLLRAVQEFGSDAAIDGAGNVTGSALPPTRFEYDETALGRLRYAGAAAVSVPLDNQNNHILQGDFNGDGRLDILVAGRQFETLLSDGNGRFRQLTATDAVLPWARDCPPSNPGCPAFAKAPSASGYFNTARNSTLLGDFNGDGKTDFLIDTSDGLYTFFAKGDGNYLPVKGPAGSLPKDQNRVLVGDFNGDGKADVLILDVLFRTLLSSGDGSYTENRSTNVPAYCRDVRGLRAFACVSADYVVTGDFNGDGLTDFLSANQDFNLFLSNGDGSFTWSAIKPPAGCDGETAQECVTSQANYNRNHFFAGDFNGDGRTDLIAARDSTIAGRDSFFTFLSTGGGGFELVKSRNLPATCTSAGACLSYAFNGVLVGDFNGDGRTDFVSASDDAVFHTWLSNGDGTFRYIAVPTPNGARSSSWMNNQEACLDPFCDARAGESALHLWQGDFNGDGKADFATLNDLGQIDVFLAETGESDAMTRMKSPSGGTMDIRYAPSTTWSASSVPVGMVLRTVASVTIADGRPRTALPPGTSETFTFSYSGARWSAKEWMFLGYATMTATDGSANVRETRFAQSEACAFQPLFSGVRDPAAWFAYTVFEYAETVSDAYRCLLTKQSDCESNGGNTCRWTGSNRTWTDFGEVSELLEYGRLAANGDERYTVTQYSPNYGSYIVTLPAARNVYEGASASGALLARTQFIYDGNPNESTPPAKGDLTAQSTWDKEANSWVTKRYAYDARGNVTRTTDAAGVSRATTYDRLVALYPVGSCLCEGQNCNRYCTATDWNMTLGAPIATTDANQQVSRTKYDVFGRRTSATYPDGGSTSWSFEFTGDPERQHIRTLVADGSERGIWTDSFQDGLGREYRVLNSSGSERYFGYADASSPPYRSSTWYDSDNPPAETLSAYDALKRPVRITNADGSVTRTFYTQDDTNVYVTSTDELGHQRGAVIDAYGRVERIREQYTSKDSGSCSHRVDILGAPLPSACSACAAAVCAANTSCCANQWNSACVQKANDVCPSSNTVFADTTFGYDALGRLTRVTDALGNRITVTWDSRGYKRQLCDPDTGCWKYDYLPNGLPLMQVDAKGQTTTFRYDSFGRKIKREERDAAGREKVVTYAYDRDSTGTAHGSSEGRVVTIADPSGSTEYWYDSMGRVTTLKKVVTGVTVWQQRNYDVAGRVKSIQYPDLNGSLSGGSEIVSYTYDAQGRVSGMTPYVPSIRYTPDSSIDSIRLGNGTTTAFRYDVARRWLTRMSVSDPTGAELLSMSYAYDSAGRVTGVNAQNPSPSAIQYTYDEIGRLTTVRGDQTFDYAYDPIGNMIYNSAIGNFAYPASGPDGCGKATPCKGPHAASVTGLPGNAATATYDDNGNLTKGNQRTIPQWDVSNRPVLVVSASGTTEFAYDSEEARVQSSTPDAATRYFGDLIEIGPEGVPVKYYYAAGRLVARRDSSGRIQYYHLDHLGSPRLITDASGSATMRYEYSPFGQQRQIQGAGSVSQPIAFSGAVQDAGTGLLQMNARYYDSTLGRFLSADSVVPSASNPQALNRYSYAYNSPLLYIDPSGHMPIIGGCGPFYVNCPYTRVGQIVQSGKVMDWGEWMLLAGPPQIGPSIFGLQNGLRAIVEWLQGQRSRPDWALRLVQLRFSGVELDKVMVSVLISAAEPARFNTLLAEADAGSGAARVVQLSPASQKTFEKIQEIIESIGWVRVLTVLGVSVEALELNYPSAVEDPVKASEALTEPLGQIGRERVKTQIMLLEISGSWNSLSAEEKALWNLVLSKL